MRARYSRWDGTQVGLDLDADALLDEMTDDLLYHGDLNAALRRMMQQGFRDREGRNVAGMREMLERLRDRRREQLERYDLGGVYGEIAQRLDEIVEQEREGMARRADDARASGDRRREELLEDLARQRREQLDQLPPDLAGRVSELQQYDWMDDAARQQFEALMEELRRQLLDSMFNQLSQGMSSMSPEQLARMKDMLAELNHMLEQRERGEEPDFEGFMERYGDFFPGNPQSLDELLEQMARSMAQMQQLLNSMTPEQRAQLQELANSLLDDMDLRWQVDQLGQNLRNAFPQMGWGQRMPFRGDEPMPLGQMNSLLDQLGDIDALEHLLRNATNPGQLAEVDLDQVRELLGDDAARALAQLAKIAKELEEAGLIEQSEGRMELTPKGIRRIGQRALGDLFRRLLQDRSGKHDIERSGHGHERSDEHKPYEFGDPFHLDVGKTIRNAITRQGTGTPVRIRPEDFEIERTEQITCSATVLMLDVSLSMEMRGRFLAAKKVAMALHALITTQFPRDYLGMVSFGRVAREVKPARLPEATWDFEWGTNMQHAMMLARRMLASQSGRKQIIMITDGEPTAHIENGEPWFDYPPSPRTIEMTLREVQQCTKDQIRINTFMLEDNYYLREFVERMMRMNRGRAFFTTPENLGDYVLVDFLEHRKQQRHAS
ncbi:MAG: VWA domain-containing protein [Actinomycetota bacterium]